MLQKVCCIFVYMACGSGVRGGGGRNLNDFILFLWFPMLTFWRVRLACDLLFYYSIKSICTPLIELVNKQTNSKFISQIEKYAEMGFTWGSVCIFMTCSPSWNSRRISPDFVSFVLLVTLKSRSKIDCLLHGSKVDCLLQGWYSLVLLGIVSVMQQSKLLITRINLKRRLPYLKECQFVETKIINYIS